MSVSKYLPHFYVLPEDDADRQLANGFLLHPKLDLRSIQVLPEAGGWAKVRSTFETDHIRGMERYPNRHMILLVDFDGQSNRLAEIKKVIPEKLMNRVFVIGVWSEPEDLKKRGLGTLETIGVTLANECQDGKADVWNHELLRHNQSELNRMTSTLRGILFSSC